MTSGGQTLRFRPIAVAVVHTARRHAWRILVVSIVVSAVTVAVDLAADHLLDRADVTSAVAGAVSTSTVSLLGAVFLSGFLCRLVTVSEHGKTEHGKTEHGKTGHGKTGHGKTGPEAEGSRIRDVLWSLPWGSLILADLLVTLIVLIGLVALIVPGLIAITLLSVAGPVIELERQHAVAGLRRCVRLVRPHFWRVAAFGTVPLLVANGVIAVLPDPSGPTDVVTTLIVRSIGEGVVEAAVGLVLVELCFRLIAADHAAAAAAAGAAAAAPTAPPGGLAERGHRVVDRGRPHLVVAPGQGGLVVAARGQRGQGGREAAAAGLARDAFRVPSRVHVQQLRYLADPQARVPQPVQLDPAGVVRRHRHAQDQPRIRLPQAEQPEAAVLGRPEHGVCVPGGQRPRHRLQQPGGHLRSVHADEHDRDGELRVGVVERGGDPLVQPPAALLRHLEAGRQLRPQGARRGPLVIQGQQVPGERGAGPGLQRVDERRLGQRRGLLRGERRGEPGLDPARHRGLGQDDELGRPFGGCHEASTRRMSRTVRTVPLTVPVTLDRPDRGR
jgi:hypothetical protein